MTWLKKITSNSENYFFILFVFIHLALLNINFAEWGDSYRILRASEYVRDFSYPQDEKRPPLYSMLLALRPSNIDQILWGRIIMLFVSIGVFYIFLLFLRKYNFSSFQKNLALILFIFNPVFLYWSLRIYADVFFTLIAIFTLYLFDRWKNNLKYKQIIFLGFLLGLSVLTRFEGYILCVSLGAGIFFNKSNPFKNLLLIFKQNLVLFLGFIIVVLPWWLYQNPLSSSYFSEPSGRIYNAETIYIYFVSLFFAFGFTSIFFFMFKNLNFSIKHVTLNMSIISYVFLQLFLALIWPAAIPRLFVPAIPFLIIFFVYLIGNYFEKGSKSVFNLVIPTLLLCFYVLSQYLLRLQFLILNKHVFILIILFQLLIILFTYLRKKNLFLMATLMSCIIWSVSTILLHKDIYKAVVSANLYIVNNLSGTIAFNKDNVSSISDWYINYSGKNLELSGIFLNMDTNDVKKYNYLIEKEVDYLLVTNEHNTTFEFTTDELTYLDELQEFRYNVSGKEFFSKIIEFKRSYEAN